MHTVSVTRDSNVVKHQLFVGIVIGGKRFVEISVKTFEDKRYPAVSITNKSFSFSSIHIFFVYTMMISKDK